jgi:hypothetical protein
MTTKYWLFRRAPNVNLKISYKLQVLCSVIVEEQEQGPTSRYEVTTPNYLLVIGGFESQNAHIFNKTLPIWRLRVSQELFNTEA